MVPIRRLVRVERVPSTVKAHHRGDRCIAEHTRLSFERYKLWYWTPRGYVTKVVKYKRKRLCKAQLAAMKELDQKRNTP